AAAWAARADELGAWLLERAFVRRDRFGGYYVEDKATQKTARPNKGARTELSLAVAVRHFKATRPEDIIGAYALTAGENGVGRWVTVDIDAHGPGDDPGRNEKYAVHLYRTLTRLGLHVLLLTWGNGGYHL